MRLLRRTASCVLAVMLVQDAWRSTRQTLTREAQQQCVKATQELQAQFADRASVLAASPASLPIQFEAQDISLRGLSAAVLRSYDAMEGGFLLGPDNRLAGHVNPVPSAAQELNPTEAGFLRTLAQRSRTSAQPVFADVQVVLLSIDPCVSCTER